LGAQQRQTGNAGGLREKPAAMDQPAAGDDLEVGCFHDGVQTRMLHRDAPPRD
jgi:hypothetical protein